jgi:hypothetical protein
MEAYKHIEFSENGTRATKGIVLKPTTEEKEKAKYIQLNPYRVYDAEFDNEQQWD